jgi:pyridoxal phosphate enzyme (YggS family)
MIDYLSLPVDVMAVSKFQPAENILPLISQGYVLFGENRVQEAALKWPNLLEENPQCRLNLIGPLQTNKIRQALQLFDGIESIDRHRLVDEIIKCRAHEKTKTAEFLIQVNIGKEPQKSGVMPEAFNDLYSYCLAQELPISGVMCIPPADQDPTPFFNQLKAMAQAVNIPVVSMGMSSDYEQAIACGSTRIRLGTALFGARIG